MPAKPFQKSTPSFTENTRQNNVILSTQATKALLDGIKIATDAIRISYGATGVNAIIEQEFEPYHIVANDCETILQSIQAKDRYQKVGLDILKELSSKANRDSGDGRKTTCIMAEEIITLGYKSKALGVKLKRELDSLIPLIEKKIDRQKKDITVDDVKYVATIAGESTEIGNNLQEIFKTIGKDGIINPEPSGTSDTTWEYVRGVRFNDTGYLSRYMCNNTKNTFATYKNPVILVTKRKINSIDDINDLLKTLTTNSTFKGRALVIFADDMDSGVASLLIKAHREGVIKCLIIKAPVLWKNYIFEDFARVTGSTVVEDSTGVTFKNLSLDHLGTCDTITCDENETTIMGGNDIQDHIDYLKGKNDNDSKLRLSWLNTNTCILRIGANNESELSYKRLKYYDAINATKMALKDGIVAGGGIALINATTVLPVTLAGRILHKALTEPFRQLLDNSGVKDKETFEKEVRKTPNYGYDCQSGYVVDMYEKGIVDAAAVVKNAVRNAISLASTVLTGRIVIGIPEKTAEQVASEALQKKGLRF